MAEESIALDSFVLEHRLGAGGMGEVWKGHHHNDDVDVAVKVLTQDRARVARYREDFRREVQAIARLNHPHIVMVYDYGAVSKEAQEASGGVLVAGSPYLAMEYASRGALDGLEKALDWAEIRRMLLALLDGLGHSHSRRIIHRDIKPGNILLGSERDIRPTLKLTDFGLAHASQRQTSTRGEGPTSESVEDAAGTPAYMAPEQFRGLWRDYGPWTDLYALGIVAFELVCGRPPFLSEHFYGYADFHLYKPLPPLEAKVAVPAGFDAWLNRMAAKSISERFRRAADAAWALQKLGDPAPQKMKAVGVPAGLLGKKGAAGVEQGKEDDVDPTMPTVDDTAVSEELFGEMETLATAPEPARQTGPLGKVYETGNQRTTGGGEARDISEMPTMLEKSLKEEGDSRDLSKMATLEAGQTVPALDTIESVPSSRPARDLSEGLYGEDIEMVAPPLPEDWRLAEEVPEPVPLLGVGLGLYGLREIPMVDREEERELLWSLLQETATEKLPRVAVLEGVSGAGKSQLARWLCHLADEVGAATVLRASYEPSPGTVVGLSRMLAEFFRVVGMRVEEAEERLETIIGREGGADDYEWRALAEFVRPLTLDDRQRVKSSFEFSSPRQRFVLLHRFLRRLGRGRPVILWMDDVQWGSEALMMTRHVLEESDELSTPVLFVLTAQSEALAEREVEKKRLERLSRRDDVYRRRVGPLPEEDTAQLVRNLLGLSGELAERVTERSGGNPLFAVELVGDWVDRGVLELGERGFVLRSGEKARFPDDLHSMWRERIGHILEEYRGEGREALEVASLLGQEVVEREWRAICERLGLEVSTALMEHLVNSRLIIPRDEGWGFAHGMLRECLERMCEEGGRRESFHRCCDTALGEIYADRPQEIAERRAHHKRASGQLEEAASLLVRAARYRLSISEYDRVREILDRREDVLRQMGYGEREEKWIEGTLIRAEAHRLSWNFDAAAKEARKVRERASEKDWDSLYAEALAILAHVERQRGNLDQAIELNRRAQKIFGDIGDRQGVAKTTLLMAICDRIRGELVASRAHYQKSLRLFDVLEQHRHRGEAYFGLGGVERQSQNFDLARRHFQRARDIADAIGAQQLLAQSFNGLAEIARYKGDLKKAEAGYRRALKLYESIGVGDQVLPRLNLGLVHQERDEYGEARRYFEEGLARLDETGQRGFQGWTHANLLPALAHFEEWKKWDEHCDRAVQLLDDTGLVDADIARAATEAGEMMRKKGYPQRARRAFELARKQWEAAGDEGRVAAVEERLQNINEM